MNIPSKFDDIRPFEPQELPAVYERLLADPQFLSVLAYLYPQVPVEAIAQKMKACNTNMDFQLAFCYDFLKNLMAKASTGFDMDVSGIDVEKRYTFVRVKDLVRVNKSFIVERSLPPRQMLMASKRLAEYMHFVISEKNDNVWIAQREGRAKDSNDRTQSAILKMMAMASAESQPTDSPVERLRQLHIVPLAISYEFDPCDFLKAREFQLKRDIEGWKKSKHDDVVSMQTGIMGYKGEVHYHCAPCIDDFLCQLPADLPKTEVFDVIAAHIDEEIHRNYRLYPGNYVALDMLSDTNAFAGHYTPEQKQQFVQYIESQLAKITDVPNKDEAYLRECMLTMYANPAVNYLSAK